jgi:hypothetical protein
MTCDALHVSPPSSDFWKATLSRFAPPGPPRALLPVTVNRIYGRYCP